MLEGSILQKLAKAHEAGQGGRRPLNFGVYYKNTLVALCHALEDHILEQSEAPLVITAFQRGKWYLQEADRYGQIAAKSRQVVILATPDTGFADHSTSQLENVSLVSLGSTDPVAQEWHLMILSPTYTAMVLCQELSAQDYGAAGVPTEDLERKFYGFWTFEPQLVLETVEFAIDHLGDYTPDLKAQLLQQMQMIQSLQQEGPDPSCFGTILAEAVPRIVNYLKDSQTQLNQSTQTYDLAGLHTDILDNNLVSNELQAFLRMAQIIDQTDVSNPMAAAEVAALSEMMGQLLDLPAWQLHRLRLAGLLHRIALFQSPETFLVAGLRYRDETNAVPLSCPLIPGIQALRTMPRLRAIATILAHQSEWWDGSGQPAGLSGDEIPLESRILGLVSEFQRQLNHPLTRQTEHVFLQLDESCMSVLAECQALQGKRWDPKLVEALMLLVAGLRQGVNLPIQAPKIAAGMWLLDSHSEEQLLNFYHQTTQTEENRSPEKIHG